MRRESRAPCRLTARRLERSVVLRGLAPWKVDLFRKLSIYSTRMAQPETKHRRHARQLEGVPK
jgi:hypothetical protein